MGIDLNPSLPSVYTLRRLANQNTQSNFELLPSKGRKCLFSPKRAFFDLKLAVTRIICKIGMQNYTFLKSA